MPSSRRDPEARETNPNETHPKQGQTEEKLLVTPRITGPLTHTVIDNTTHTITPTMSSSHFVRTTNEIIGTDLSINQGRISTLSSMVRLMPTTATKTVAITQEGGRDDAIATVRQLLVTTSTSTAMTELNYNVNTFRVGLMVSTSTVQAAPRITETGLSSSPSVSRITGMTAPLGMAAPISQDLIWPGHPDIQGTSLFPPDDDPTTVAAGGLDPEERWKIHHPYDIPGVRRPTMETPGNLRRLAACEALVESLQTMEYLIEFPTLEER